MRFIYKCWIFLFVLILWVSCDKNEIPVSDFYFENIDHNVQFTGKVTHADSYQWDFGDGETSTELSPLHTYQKIGDYTVTFKAIGVGGEAMETKTVSVAGSLKDILFGPDGSKTWVLSKAVFDGDCVAPIDQAISPKMVLTNNVLAMDGIQEEYDNEFTFNQDGSYTMNPKNGHILCGTRYAESAVDQQNVIKLGYMTMMSDIVGEGIDDATWELHENQEFSVDVIDDPEFPLMGDGKIRTATFKGVNCIEIKGGYFGVKDFSNYCVIRKATAKQLQISFFVYALSLSNFADKYNKYPSMMFTVSYVPKE